MNNYEELLSKIDEIILILKNGQFANQTPKKKVKRVNNKRGNDDMQRGSITYRSDGRWMGRCYDEYKKQKCVYGRTKKECSEKLRVLIDEVEKNRKSSIVSSSDTLYTFFEIWMKLYKEPTIKESTAVQNRRLMMRCLNRIGNLQIKSINAQLLQDTINSISSEGEKKIAYSYLKQMYEKLFFLGVIQQNLMGMVVIANTEKNIIREISDDRIKNILELGEENKIKYKAREKEFKHYIEFAINTGMRPGEILGLQKKDLDFEKNQISINKQLNATTGKISSPKSKKGNRIIPMFEKTKEILLDMKVKLLEENDFIFTLQHGNIQYFMKKLEKEQNILITSKMLRKTFSSRCQHLYGIDQKQVQAWLGHENPETTDKHYTFISNEETLANIEKYNQMVRHTN